MSVSRHNNLANKAGEPSRSTLMVQTTVHSPVIDRIPKERLEEWLASLPEGARVSFSGVYSGKAQWTASWKEER